MDEQCDFELITERDYTYRDKVSGQYVVSYTTCFHVLYNYNLNTLEYTKEELVGHVFGFHVSFKNNGVGRVGGISWEGININNDNDTHILNNVHLDIDDLSIGSIPYRFMVQVVNKG